MNSNASIAQRLAGTKASYTKTLANAENLTRAGQSIINDPSPISLEAYNGWKAWSKLALDTVQRLREIPLGLPDLVARLTLPAEEEEAIDQLVNHCESKQLEPKLVALRAVHLRVLPNYLQSFQKLVEWHYNKASMTRKEADFFEYVQVAKNLEKNFKIPAKYRTANVKNKGSVDSLHGKTTFET
uniref:Uncharacterized protein n=1 Tax=Caenorhabditis japonica TaxID=281687 RepID=A0A8R1IAH9_CAEJA